jgi:hypothetical protein
MTMSHAVHWKRNSLIPGLRLAGDRASSATVPEPHLGQADPSFICPRWFIVQAHLPYVQMWPLTGSTRAMLQRASRPGNAPPCDMPKPFNAVRPNVVPGFQCPLHPQPEEKKACHIERQPRIVAPTTLCRTHAGFGPNSQMFCAQCDHPLCWKAPIIHGRP